MVCDQVFVIAQRCRRGSIPLRFWVSRPERHEEGARCKPTHPAARTPRSPPHRHGSPRWWRGWAMKATRGSFADAAAAIERATGVRVAKRQVEELTGRAAADVAAFYTARAPGPGPDTDVLAMQYDGKGVVMRPDALREATAKTA